MRRERAAGVFIQLYKQRVEDHHHVRVWLGKCVGVTNVPKGGCWDQMIEVVGKQDLLMLPASIPYGSGSRDYI